MSVPDVAPGNRIALDYRAFRLPRQGYSLEECQDAVAADAERGRFAIADGAAESPYSALWAHLLVEEFVRQSEPLPFWADWLPSLQQRWAAASGSVLERAWMTPLDAGVPWYLEPGLIQGAFATFLGLVVEETNWHALAVGDSCLFQVRQDRLIQAFPLTRAAEFGNAPWLVGSRTSPIEVPRKNGVQVRGDWQRGDRFWLMTDALAQWFLVEVEAGRQPWLELEPRAPRGGEGDDARAAFAAWIDQRRAARQLRNDDVTLLVVSV
jgi:hypothetical protein